MSNSIIPIEGLEEINKTDTILQFMDKCNSNFAKISKKGGGPAGVEGDEGSQGVPAKPKVPIHVWKQGVEYDYEYSTSDGFTIIYNQEILEDKKYQEGHLILLQNAHVYVLETDNLSLTPKYLLGLQSYNNNDVIDGKNAYVHIAYANEPNSYDGLEIVNNGGSEPVATYGLRRTVSENNFSNKPYMGIYSDNVEASSNKPTSYTWLKIIGEKGEKGDSKGVLNGSALIK